MGARLYGIGISHPSHSARLMLERKGIEHSITWLLPGSQKTALRAVGFRGGTVPALRIDGRRIQGSRTISRALDRIQPDPPLFPADPEERAAVEEAERWGDEVFQAVPRRAFRWGTNTDIAMRRRVAKMAGLPLAGVAAVALKPVAAYYARDEDASERHVRANMEELPAMLDHVDGLIAAGTIGGPEPNAADFQIAPTVAILASFADLRELIQAHAAGEWAAGLMRFKREIEPFLPAEFIPLKAASSPAE